MGRETLDLLDKETLIRLILSQMEAIERLRVNVSGRGDDDPSLIEPVEDTAIATD